MEYSNKAPSSDQGGAEGNGLGRKNRSAQSQVMKTGRFVQEMCGSLCLSSTGATYLAMQFLEVLVRFKFFRSLVVLMLRW